MKDYFTEEEVTTKKNKKHYVKNNQTEEIKDIHEAINKLRTENIDNKRIFGYVLILNGNRSICKYDKKTGLFITLIKDKTKHEFLSWGEYQGRKAYEYYDEIRP